MTGTLRYGTSSWSEKSWVGPFYPEGTATGDFLTEYARHFDTVEADNTYYRVPSAKMVDGWADKTPDGFLLAAKFPRSVVHAGDGPRPDAGKVLEPEHCGEDTARFLEVMGRLGDKCGPLVLQFPYFNKSAFAEPGPFLDRLDAFLTELPAGFRYGVEIRNKNWVGEPLLEILRRHSTALVLVDLLYMPHPKELADRFDLVTTDFVYGRLIGDRKAVDDKTDTFDRIVVDQSKRLDGWAELLETLMDRVPSGFVYANNHYAGHGPATIRDLMERYTARRSGS